MAAENRNGGFDRTGALRFRLSAFLIILAVTVYFFIPVQVSAEGSLGDTGSPPVLDAKAAILADSESGEVLFEQNADTPLFVGGTAALMTALLAFEAVNSGEVKLDDMITTGAEAYFDIPAEAIAGGKNTQSILVGETMSLSGLLYCALIGSSSEACNIIASYLSGADIPAFINRMNLRAEELGCTNTHFVNTHGLPYGGNQYSTARDLSRIASEAVKHAKLVEIADAVSIEIEATNASDIRYIANSNYLIRPDYPRYYYSYACGLKNTGSEIDGFSLVTSVDVDGKFVIAVLLGTRMTEAESGYYDIQSFVQAKRLFEWFFDNYSYRDIISTIEPIIEVPVEIGEDADSVVAKSKTGLSLFLPNNLDLNSTFKRNITIYSMQEGAEPLRAPINEGAVLGEMTVEYMDRTFGPFVLVANTSVEVSRFELMKRNAAGVFKNPWIRLGFFGFFLIIALYIVFVIRYNMARARKRRAFNERSENAVTTIPRDKR